MLKGGGGGRAGISDGSSRRENRLRRKKGAKGGRTIRTKGRPPYIGTLLLACQLSETVECLNSLSLSLFLFFPMTFSAIALSRFNVANRPRQRGKGRKARKAAPFATHFYRQRGEKSLRDDSFPSETASIFFDNIL